MPVRFGLVGTGYWARELHAVGVAGHPDAELAAVWGRDAGKAEAVAGPHGARAFAGSEGYDDMLADVDAVVFAVPPDVQAPLALRAAEAGRHLLLEKPVALSAAAADEVAAAAERTGVASVVFFTERFVPEREAWLQERAAAGCLGGSATWLASLRTPDNPFADSAWRQEQGGLWDVGPHALSVAAAGARPGHRGRRRPRTRGPGAPGAVPRGRRDQHGRGRASRRQHWDCPAPSRRTTCRRCWRAATRRPGCRWGTGWWTARPRTGRRSGRWPGSMRRSRRRSR